MSQWMQEEEEKEEKEKEKEEEVVGKQGHKVREAGKAAALPTFAAAAPNCSAVQLQQLQWWR